jgi:hypothetical protein
MNTDPGFILRGRFHGREVEVRWRAGELVEAPDDLRTEVGQIIATRRWVEWDVAYPWREAGEATMTDRWLAQATLLAVLEPESIELEDPVLEAETES